MSGIFGGCILVDGPLGPQPLHGETQDNVLKRWQHPFVAEAKGPITVCACCDGPAVALIAGTGELPGGVSRPVLCSRCGKITEEQADLLVAALRRGYPEVRSEQ